MTRAPRIDPVNNPSGTPRREVGGQALIEGVLIRSRTGYAVAARRPGGELVVRQVPWRGLSRRGAPWSWPGVRAVVALVEMTAIGGQALLWSAKESESDEPAEARLPKTLGEAWRAASFPLALAVGTAVAVALFVAAPGALAAWTGGALLGEWARGREAPGFNEADFPVLWNFLAGAWRAVLVVLYVAGLGALGDLRRVFAYHGAEHMAVHALEAGRPLAVEDARSFPPRHPRCGASFIAVAVLVSAPLFAAASAWMSAAVSGFPDWPGALRLGATLALHAALLPVAAAGSFELLKAASRHPERRWAQAVLAPGLAFQRLTTRRPDDAQLETALAALRAALAIAPGRSAERIFVVHGLHSPRANPARPAPPPPEPTP